MPIGKKKLTKNEQKFVDTMLLTNNKSLSYNTAYNPGKEIAIKGTQNSQHKIETNRRSESVKVAKRPHIAQAISEGRRQITETALIYMPQMLKELARLATGEDVKDTTKLRAIESFIKMGGFYEQNINLNVGSVDETVYNEAVQRALTIMNANTITVENITDDADKNKT